MTRPSSFRQWHASALNIALRRTQASGVASRLRL